jgi:hypothetical protein
MAATAGATGLRTWLQTHHFTWLTPRRLRRLTMAAIVVAALVSTIGLSGSTSAGHTVGAHGASATVSVR